jgi:hypothetical protein
MYEGRIYERCQDFSTVVFQHGFDGFELKCCDRLFYSKSYLAEEK